MLTSRVDASLDPLVKPPTLDTRQWLKEYVCACTLEHIHAVNNPFTQVLFKLGLPLYSKVTPHKNLCCAQLGTWPTLVLSDHRFLYLQPLTLLTTDILELGGVLSSIRFYF